MEDENWKPIEAQKDNIPIKNGKNPASRAPVVVSSGSGSGHSHINHFG